MVHKRSIVIGLLLLGCLPIAPVSHAKDFYFGATLGRTDAEDLELAQIDDGSLLVGTVDGSDNGWKIFGGFKLFRFMTTELDYRDYGQVSFSATSDGTGTIYAAGQVDAIGDIKAISVAALVVVPAGKFNFWAKGGVANWSIDIVAMHSAGSQTDRKEDGTDVLFGVGGSWDFPGPGAIRVEHERIEMGGRNQDFTSIGVQIRF